MPALALRIAACLTIGLGIFHSVLGERYILVRLFRRPQLPKLFGSDVFTRRTLRFAWHLTTLAWFGLAAILWTLAGSPSAPGARTVLEIVAATALASALAAAIGSRGRHLAWVVFLAISLLVFWSTR